jgi:hypothetical protein
MLNFSKIRMLTAVSLFFWASGAVPAEASCHLFPGVERTYSSALGSANRPWAAPGESIEVRHRSCDTQGAAPALMGRDNLVTVAFLEPEMTGASLVILADRCDEGLIERVAGCRAAKAVENAVCVEVPGVALENLGDGKLRFPFPDTAEITGEAGWAGPARIAVTDRSADLPCALARRSCKEMEGTSICVDEFFQDDGACDDGTPATTFDHFTALPRPNSFSAGCFQSEEICEAREPVMRLAADRKGNLFLPVDWSGVLAEQDDFPVPRIVRAAIRSPIPFSIPDEVFVGSFTADGGRLPPIFTPLFDHSGLAPTEQVVFFGSADAPYTILRFARRFGSCRGGSDEERLCEVDIDCPGRGALCERACVQNPSDLCERDADCGAHGPCGELFDPAALQAGLGGPELPRRPLEIPFPPSGVCQFAQDQECRTDIECTNLGNPEDLCVHWALEAGDAVPLDGILETPDLWAFTFEEWLDGVDRNGDGDKADTVVTMRSRSTGVLQGLGLHPACQGPSAGGRATIRLLRGDFDFPAVAVEGHRIAFLEPESDYGPGCDMDFPPDGDTAGVILAVAQLGTEEVFVSRWAAVDLNMEIDGNALALSPITGTGQAIAFARFDEAEASTDLYPDGNLDDVVLGLVDELGTTEIFCPAAQVATANGAAVFLRPEDGGNAGTTDCPVGPLNGDGDTDDKVVQLLRRDPGGTFWRVRNMELAATAVDLSTSWIAALADEAGQPGVGGVGVVGGVGNGDSDSDSDSLDQVVHIRSLAEPLQAQVWINLGHVADRFLLHDDILVYRVPEAEQGEDLNQNEESDSLLFVAAAGAGAPQMLEPAVDFVLGEEQTLCPGTNEPVRLLAYTTPTAEWTPGAVALRVFNTAHTGGQFPAAVSMAPGESVYACDSDACHPDKPFHVQGHEVRFLTDEAVQQEDLDGDGSMDDLVLQIYDFCAARRRTVGAIDLAALDVRNPLAAPTSLVSGEVLVQRTGRCLQPVPMCSFGDPECCPRGSSLSRVDDGMACIYASPTSCSVDADCGMVANATVSCVTRAVTVAVSAADADEDGVIDAADSCDENALVGSCVDGAHCRKASSAARLATRERVVQDALGAHVLRVQSIEGACRTAGLAGAAVNDASAMATRWRIREAGFDKVAGVRIKDRFGVHEVTIRKPSRLLRAAQQASSKKTLSSNDHLCYQVREVKPEVRVRNLTLEGAGGQRASYEVRRLRQLCLPASFGSSTEVPSAAAWSCYRANLSRTSTTRPWSALLEQAVDGFGSHDLRLGADREVCVRARVSRATLERAPAAPEIPAGNSAGTSTLSNPTR